MSLYNDSSDIMVFRPTFEEFKDFSGYIKYMESKGAHKGGIAKIIPPKEWTACRRYNMKTIGEIDIHTPVSQAITGQQGLLQLFNLSKKKMKVKDFKEMAESARYKPPDGDPDNLERKYWKNMTFNPPIYGADVPGSIYDSDVKYWNISRLNTILDLLNSECKIKILGVNTAYLYFGMWRATFPWHTEDMDLYSINYLHFGASKFWYSIPPEHGKRLETLAKGFFSGSAQDCTEFMRHKMTIISPQVLKKFSIPVNKMVQNEGEFIVTFPFGYHCGFNQGFNCAESTNFASERWIDFGKKANHCKCKGDSVKIDMDIFIKKFQPDEWKKIIEERKQKEEKHIALKKTKSYKRTSYSSDSKEEASTEESSNESEEIVADRNSNSDGNSSSSYTGNSNTEQSEEESEDPTEKSQKSGKTSKPIRTFKMNSSRKKVLPKKRLLKVGSKRRLSNRQKNIQLSKRHPIHNVRVVDIDEAASSSDSEDDSKDKSRVKHASIQKPRNDSLLSVEELWTHLPYKKSSEIHFNKQLSQTTTKCAVCVYFSQQDANHLNGASTELNNNFKRHTLAELKVGKCLVTELCFAEHNSSEEQSIELAFNLMFGKTEEMEVQLLICDICHVAVHNSCYGVDKSTPKWLCDKCTFLESLCESEYMRHINDVCCCLCNIRGGALKSTTDGKWCHIVCAIAFPEVSFVNQKKRGPINISSLNPARLKLHCVYCYQSTSSLRGACIQCKCGKCATPFHITCSFHHGIPLYLGDWPVLIEALCPKHVKQKFIVKNDNREMSEVATGDIVIAKHKNGRYYKGRVGDVTLMLYYKVIFEDKSFCFDLPPQDIQEIDANETIVESGTIVKVLWTDGLVYNAEVTGHWYEPLCQVRFEDSSLLNIKRSDLYIEGETLPKRIQSKISYASETANKFYLAESLQTASKRRPRVGRRKCSLQNQL